MSPPPPGRTAVTVFSGGRGGATIARGLLRTPGVRLSLVINGYDNGMSTGALRRYLPGMLGPSDFRKNLLLHLDDRVPGQAALITVLRLRLPAGATQADLDALLDDLAPGQDKADRPFAALPSPARAAIVRDLTVLRHRLEADPSKLDLADCALGNLLLAGAYLRLGGDFNAAVRACARTFGSPARLMNVTNGENAFLVALKRDGRLLADEADIVAAQDDVAITDLFLLREPVTTRLRAELVEKSVEQLRQALASHRATLSLSPLARDALRDADLIVYGPGTPHSSLLPSYLTPGVAEAIAASRARARVFVVNIGEDHDVRGLSAPDLVDRTLAYLGDPTNERGTITHVLCHSGDPEATGAPPVPAEVTERGRWAGSRWITVDLVDPAHPGIHCGRRTVAALVAVVAEATARPPPAGGAANGAEGTGGAVARRRVWFCDLDGTLVDSAPVHEAAFRDAIAEVAPDLLDSFSYDAHAGATTREVVAGLGVEAGLAERLVRRKQQLYRRYVDAGRVAVFPGVHRLLHRLARRGCTAYLVTSGSRGSVEQVLAACRLRGHFRGVLTGDDVPAGKPDPVVYREACRRWAVDPDDAIAVEDSAHGVASALGAGLVTLQVHATGPAAPGAVPVRHLDEIVSLLDPQPSSP